jgi:predicted MFS family arabinose efflux permease
MFAPPVTAALAVTLGWRSTLFLLGLMGIPLVLVIVWQSAILRDQSSPKEAPQSAMPSGHKLLLTRPMLLFFGFFFLSAMATAGIQSWLIPILHDLQGLSLESASVVLTAFMFGATSGILMGGWFADHSDRHLSFTIALTVAAAALVTLVAFKSMTHGAILGVLFIAGLLIGASRTPRDIMLKDASPPGQTGKVFGFVSAGLSLGSALAPVPFGYLIDKGRPDFVLALVALILLSSLLCVGTARATARRATSAEPQVEIAQERV